MAQSATLGWIDYFVIFLMLVVSSSIGIYYRLTGGRQKTTQVRENNFFFISYKIKIKRAYCEHSFKSAKMSEKKDFFLQHKKGDL